MAFTLTLKPEVERRLREVAADENRSAHKTVEEAVQRYLDRYERTRWVQETVRRVYREDAEFFEMLGDR